MSRTPTKASRLRRKPETFRHLADITPEDFDEIIEELPDLYEEAERSGRLSRPDRERAIGAGRKFTLALEDCLLMLLMYYRLYITHEFLGFLFDIDDSNVGRNINPLEPLLAQIFRPIERRRIDTGEDEVATLFFRCDRTTGSAGQKKPRRDYHSGKQEHTIKHQVAVDESGKIQAVSPSYPGSVHDKRMYDTEQVVIPRQAEALGDLGYQGSDGKVKMFNAMSECFRNERSRHAPMFKNIAGLCNLRFAS